MINYLTRQSRFMKATDFVPLLKVFVQVSGIQLLVNYFNRITNNWSLSLLSNYVFSHITFVH